MKKAIVFSGVFILLTVIVLMINLPGQLLSFFLVGLIPYTTVTVPPVLMLCAWLLMPVLLFAGVNLIRGLFHLVMIIAEQIEYAVKAHIDAAVHDKQPNILQRLVTRAGGLKTHFLKVLKSMQKKFKHLPKLRYRKISDLHEA